MLKFCRDMPDFSAVSAAVKPFVAMIYSIFLLLIFIYSPPITTFVVFYGFDYNHNNGYCQEFFLKNIDSFVVIGYTVFQEAVK